VSANKRGLGGIDKVKALLCYQLKFDEGCWETQAPEPQHINSIFPRNIDIFGRSANLLEEQPIIIKYQRNADSSISDDNLNTSLRPDPMFACNNNVLPKKKNEGQN